MDKSTILQIYGGLLVLGGAIGFAKKQSVPSLVAGSGSGLLVLYLTQSGVESNKLALQLISLALFLGMGFRANKSGKFMPAGLVSLLSALALGAVSV